MWEFERELSHIASDGSVFLVFFAFFKLNKSGALMSLGGDAPSEGGDPQAVRRGGTPLRGDIPNWSGKTNK